MRKILIVDDDPDIIEVCRVILQEAGFHVVSAGGRKEGMAAVGQETPELIILDVMMDEPDDGFHLAQDLRSNGVQIPILMMTSIGRVSGFSFGIDDELLPVNAFIEKPATPETLLAHVNRLLNINEGGN